MSTTTKRKTVLTSVNPTTTVIDLNKVTSGLDLSSLPQVEQINKVFSDVTDVNKQLITVHGLAHMFKPNNDILFSLAFNPSKVERIQQVRCTSLKGIKAKYPKVKSLLARNHVRFTKPDERINGYRTTVASAVLYMYQKSTNTLYLKNIVLNVYTAHYNSVLGMQELNLLRNFEWSTVSMYSKSLSVDVTKQYLDANQIDTTLKGKDGRTFLEHVDQPAYLEGCDIGIGAKRSKTIDTNIMLFGSTLLNLVPDIISRCKDYGFMSGIPAVLTLAPVYVLTEDALHHHNRIKRKG